MLEVWARFDSGRLNRRRCRQRLATAAMFLQSCVAQELSRGDDPASSYKLRRNAGGVYNENLTIFLIRLLRNVQQPCIFVFTTRIVFFVLYTIVHRFCRSIIIYTAFADRYLPTVHRFRPSKTFFNHCFICFLC